MGLIVETTNPHLEYELRRESFILHDDELVQEHPEFGYERVFGLQALIAGVIDSKRFQDWLAKQEGRRRPYVAPYPVRSIADAAMAGHDGYDFPDSLSKDSEHYAVWKAAKDWKGKR